MKYVIGVDGGGTSTLAVIVSEDGTVIAKAEAGPSNPNTTNKEQLAETFTTLWKTLQEQVSEERWFSVQHIFAGISGAEHKKMKAIIHDVLGALCTEKMKITIDNDAITALYAGTEGRPGIVQIAGTGSITFGVNVDGERGRAGGWGHLIAENSSGYYIASRGLEAAFAQIDGLGGDTLLVEKLIRHFQVGTLKEIVHSIYHHANVKEHIASLAILVFEAANEGDVIAAKILKQTGENIGETIVSLSKRLFSEAERAAGIPVVLVGSIFKQKHWLETGMFMHTNEAGFPINVKLANIQPVAGAVIAALLEENIMIDDDFVKRFQQTF